MDSGVLGELCFDFAIFVDVCVLRGEDGEVPLFFLILTIISQAAIDRLYS